MRTYYHCTNCTTLLPLSTVSRPWSLDVAAESPAKGNNKEERTLYLRYPLVMPNATGHLVSWVVWQTDLGREGFKGSLIPVFLRGVHNLGNLANAHAAVEAPGPQGLPAFLIGEATIKFVDREVRY